MTTAPPHRFEALLRAAERRLPALTRLKAAETLPVTLDRRRIYVLPTRFGLFFGGFLAVMTLGALNYNNNPALILCFLLASVAHSGLLIGFLGLRGLRLREAAAEPVHAGEPLALRLRFDAVEPRARRGLLLRQDERRAHFCVDGDRIAEAALVLPTVRRGWLPIGRIEVSVRRPFGMFVCWSWVNPDTRVLVYPALEEHPPALPIAGGDGQPRRQRGPDEEVHGLRDYTVGDPLRTIAWKRSAQLERTVVKEFESPAGRDVVLDWSEHAELPPEARIRRLASWLVLSERLGCSSELRLPDQRIGPGRGRSHLHEGLRALALLDVPGGAR